MNTQRKKELPCKEYRDAARLCKGEVEKTKAQLELGLARGTKMNKKSFYKYINQKRKINP